MTNETQFKLDLARAWLNNGREDLARQIIAKLINDGIDKNLIQADDYLQNRE